MSPTTAAPTDRLIIRNGTVILPDRLIEDGDVHGVRARGEPKPPAPRGAPAKRAKKKY